MRNFVYSCQFGINFEIECKNKHFRHILFFSFRKGKNAAQAAKMLRDVYEVCPESIGPTFISPRDSVRATSVGHERQQQNLMNLSVAC